MKYDVCGPFDLPHSGAQVDPDKEQRRDFWLDVDAYCEGLSDACGCYIFETQRRPWYVGLAQRQSFKKECLTDNKLKIYSRVLNTYDRAKPRLYLLPKLTPGGNFASPSERGHGDIGALENILIGMALARNAELVNLRGTKMLREMNVPGVLNSKPGQGSAASVRELRKVLSL